MTNLSDEQIGTVQTFTAERSFRSFNTETFEIEEVGRMGYTDFDESRQVRQLTLTHNPKPDASVKVTKLGTAGSSFRLLDHVEAVEPLLNEGWELTMVRRTTNGAGAFMTLSHPEISYHDPINWDYNIHPNTDPTLRLSIGARVDARVGRSINFHAGFFRLICTNGLISQTLEMGSLKLSHSNFSQAKIQDYSQELVSGSAGSRTLILPHYPAKALEWPIEIIDEAGENRGLLNELPDFAKKPATNLVERLPIWAHEELANQLENIQMAKNTFHTLDVLNALTNIGTQHENRSDTTIYMNRDRLMTSIMAMIAIGAFRTNTTKTMNSIILN